MPGYVLIVDLLGLILAVAGFTMAFRQATARRMLGLPVRPLPRHKHINDGEDPLTYALRIAGVMAMVFGIVLGGMVTLVHLA